VGEDKVQDIQLGIMAEQQPLIPYLLELSYRYFEFAHYFELKTIFFGCSLQSFIIGYLKLLLV